MSRHSSSTSATDPNARTAAARARAGSIPAATFSSICSSRCRRISARSSASASWPRRMDRKRRRARSIHRDMWSLLNFSHHEADRVRQTFPAFELARELFAAGRGERVELRVAPGPGDASPGLQPSLLLQAMQRWIQRTLSDLQSVFAHLLDTFRDGPSVLRFEGHGLENQQIQRSLDQVRWFAHWRTPKLSTMTPRLSTM